MPKFKNSNATFWVIFKHCEKAKTKAFLCCFAPTLTVTTEVLVSFQILSGNIGSWCLKILALVFLVAMILDLVIYYRKWKFGSFIKRLKEKNTLTFFILSVLVTIPASIAVFFFQAKSMDSKETPVMSREYNQNCLLGIYDQQKEFLLAVFFGLIIFVSQYLLCISTFIP